MCSPFVVLPVYNVAKASIDYRTGEATIGLFGYPSQEADNLDGELRLRHRYEGAPTGVEYFTMYPYDSTVRWLIRTKGFQTGSYTGYLPTAYEATAMLKRNIDHIATTSLSNESLSIYLEDKLLELDLAAQPDQLRYSLINEPILSKAQYVIQDDCLVIALNERWIYTIYLQKLDILAQYPNR